MFIDNITHGSAIRSVALIVDEGARGVLPQAGTKGTGASIVAAYIHLLLLHRAECRKCVHGEARMDKLWAWARAHLLMRGYKLPRAHQPQLLN